MPSATPIPSDERSPSPPPQAPIPSTPGIRATAFLELYNKTLTNTLTSISYSTFSECFPLIAEQAPGALKAMHESVVSRLGGFAREEFEVILKEREVVRLLNELDERIGEGRKRMARASDGEDVLVP
jgi:kinetochore protein NNF1